MKIVHVFLLLVLPVGIKCDVSENERKCDSPQYLEIGKAGTVKCDFQEDFLSVLWYSHTDIEGETPILTYQKKVKEGSGYESGEFDVHPSGSLIINEVSLKHDHFFSLAYTTQFNESDNGVITVRVIVVVPAYPVVEGCHRDQYCVLEVQDQGSLTCTLNGIRPRVQLAFKTIYESHYNSISFTNQLVDVKENGDTFDVTLTSSYHLTSADRVTIACKVVHANDSLLNRATKLDLIFSPQAYTFDAPVEIESPVVMVLKERKVVISVLVTGVIALCVLFVGLHVLNEQYNWADCQPQPSVNKSEATMEEVSMAPLNPPEPGF